MFQTREEMDAWVLKSPDYYTARLLIGRGRWLCAKAETQEEIQSKAEELRAEARNSREPLIYAVRIGEAGTFGTHVRGR